MKRNLGNCEIARKKFFGASTGFEPVAYITCEVNTIDTKNASPTSRELVEVGEEEGTNYKYHTNANYHTTQVVIR